MKHLFPFAIIVCLALSSFNFLRAQGRFAVKDVNLISMENENVKPNQTILIKDGVIEAIGSTERIKIPKEYSLIEGAGKYLMPGLFDMHTHFMYEQGMPLLHAFTESGWMLANGVTTARIMNGSPLYQKIQKEVNAGIKPGPHIILVSPQFMGDWPWKNDTITPKIIVRTPDEAVKAVRLCKLEGYAAIKITQFIKADVFDAVTAEAMRVGIPVVGHVTPNVKLPKALAAKEQIEHLDEFIEMLLPDSMKDAGSVSDINIGRPAAWNSVDYLDSLKIPALVRMVKDAGIYVTPTNYFFAANFGFGQTNEQITALPDYPFVPKELLTERSARKKNYENKKISMERRIKWIDLRRKITYALQKNGVPLMCGSDSPDWYMIQGFSIHHELKEFTDCGLSNYEALKTATVNPAKYLNLFGEKGTISKGKRADIILLSANPLEDISNTSKIEGVFRSGVYFDRKALNGLLIQ